MTAEFCLINFTVTSVSLAKHVYIIPKRELVVTVLFDFVGLFCFKFLILRIKL